MDGGEIPLFFSAKEDIVSRSPKRPAELYQGFCCEAARTKLDGADKGATILSTSIEIVYLTQSNINIIDTG